MAKGGLGGGLVCFKYFVGIFNLISAILGLALIGVSGWLISELDDLQNAFDDNVVLIAVPITGIVVGAALVMTSFFGCVGAFKEHTCMLRAYFGIMVILMVIELALVGVVLYYNYNEDFKEMLTDEGGTVWAKCDELQDEPSCSWVPRVEKQFKCCGYDAEDTGTAATTCKNFNADYTDGCTQSLLDFINDQLSIVGGTLGGIIVIQIIAMVGSCCLIRGVSDDTKYA